MHSGRWKNVLERLFSVSAGSFRSYVNKSWRFLLESISGIDLSGEIRYANILLLRRLCIWKWMHVHMHTHTSHYMKTLSWPSRCRASRLKRNCLLKCRVVGIDHICSRLRRLLAFWFRSRAIWDRFFRPIISDLCETASISFLNHSTLGAIFRCRTALWS